MHFTYLEMGSEAEERHNADEPLCRVVLVPSDGIPEVHWELVVEVVVAFANGDQSSDDVVAWRVLVVKWCLSKIMSKRVDAESALGSHVNTEPVKIKPHVHDAQRLA